MPRAPVWPDIRPSHNVGVIGTCEYGRYRGEGVSENRMQTERPVREPVVWIEVDDLIAHFAYSEQPTGIQRVVAELVAAAYEARPQRFRLCRINALTNRFEAHNPDDIDAIVQRTRYTQRVQRRYARYHRRLGYLARDIVRALPEYRQDRKGRPAAEAEFNASMRPGDILLVPGASWVNPHFTIVLARAKARHGCRVVQLVHDIIPIRHNDISQPDFVAAFTKWLHAMEASVDIFLTPSRHVARELDAFARQSGWRARPIVPIRFGTGFRSDADVPEIGLPSAVRQPYVLAVTTIDLRKNVSLLLQTWRRLLEAHGPDRVPMLVLAGHRGFKSAEILQPLSQDAVLAGHVIFLERVSDATLQALYRDAAFTAFPSRAEGWGLPVEESLAHGKFAICSNATSIPEVGGDFVDYFDPFDPDAAYDAFERAILDPGYLASRTERIVREFRPVAWQSTVDAILAAADTDLEAVEPVAAAGAGA